MHSSSKGLLATSGRSHRGDHGDPEPAYHDVVYYNALSNDPQRLYERFREKVGDLLRVGFDLIPRQDVEWTGPTFAPQDKPSFHDLAEVSRAGLELLPYSFHDEEPASWRLGAKSLRWGYRTRGGGHPTQGLVALDSDVHEHADALHLGGREEGGTRIEYRFDLRSPEAILYYLGEVVRARDDRQQVVPLYADGSPRPVEEPLFILDAAPCGSSGCPPLGVRYCGRAYFIPGGPAAGRTYHVLSLVSQLLSIHKHAEELSPSPTVRVLNQPAPSARGDHGH